jgi:hypothetical protein
MTSGGAMTVILRLIIVVCAALNLHGVWSFAQSPSSDISDKIQFTLDKFESDDKSCKSKTNHTKIACGDQYIYPVLSRHPDPAVQAKINAHILGLAPDAADDSARVEASTEIRYNKNNLLSLSHSSDAYGVGAAEHASRLLCTNIDLKTGMQISLIDVLKPGFERALPQLIRRNLDKTLKPRIPGYIANTIRAREGAWTIGGGQSFYVNERDLVLCFNDFTLSDQSTTTLQIHLPFELIDRYIDRKGSLGFAMQTTQTDTSPQFSKREENFSYSCATAGLKRRITVVENSRNAQYICHVESITGDKVSVLWRSQQDKAFCRRKATELVDRYENEWNWQCEKKS